MTTARIAVGQAAAEPGNVPANVATGCRLLDAAADRGADVLLLPEYFLCGYDLEVIAKEPDRAAIEAEGADLVPLREACRRRGVTTVVGGCLTAPGGRTNSAVVIGRDGSVRAIYDKIHLWNTEIPHFRPGDRRVLLDIAGFRVGLAICYDAGFPEHCRALALAGAELILCPSAFARGEEERRYDIYFPMRAVENTVFLAVANLVGGAGDLECFGRSSVFDPSGAPLAIAGADEEVIVVDISHERLAAVRSGLRYLEHRRPELYGPLTEAEIGDGIATVPAR